MTESTHVPRRVGIAVVVAVILLLSAGILARNGSSAHATPIYQADGMVLQNHAHGPELCLGAIPAVYPPTCGTIPITNWDWSNVSGEHTSRETTWATYHLVGTFDGTRLTLTRPPTAPREASALPQTEITTPCAAPEGGWKPPSPPISQEEAGRFQAAITDTPGFAGDWVDYMNAPNGERFFVFNAAFTDDLEQHRTQLQREWSGPLCVTQAERTLSELKSIQHRISDVPGIRVLDSGINVVADRVECDVVVIDHAQQQMLDDRFGAGAVLATPALTPVG
jgi:hypothetical protein